MTHDTFDRTYLRLCEAVLHSGLRPRPSEQEPHAIYGSASESGALTPGLRLALLPGKDGMFVQVSPYDGDEQFHSFRTLAEYGRRDAAKEKLREQLNALGTRDDARKGWHIAYEIMEKVASDPEAAE